ncbi:MAG: TraB/GumN family protein [Saprospiraceae bacterium]|nr:TraB/GumN family protein [Saprospiraceae bacterium]
MPFPTLQKLNQFILIVILLSVINTGCTAQTLHKIKVDVKPDENSLLWKIEGKKLEKPSYLFGTIHLIPEDKYFFTEKMNQAFENCSHIVFEIDMNIMEQFDQIQVLWGKMKMPDTTTLKDLVSEDDYKLLEEKITQSGLPFFMLKNIKPMFLSSLITDMGTDTVSSVAYEIKLSEKANKEGKTIGGLETIDDQIAAIDAVPLKEQAKMLVEAVKNPDSMQYDILVALYLNQDIEGLNQIIESSSEIADTKFMDNFIKNRNERWIGVMEKMMAAQPTFFAVGAGHLGGQNGVIQLLRKAGYTVTAVR